MDLLIISGFLGSGKTTLLRHLASSFESKYPSGKMAIIENEVGKIGIDGEFLKSGNLLVREINSGCICCSLRIDLIQTLLELEREHNPDLVIIEPSGVAGPKQLMQSLVGYGGEIDNKRMVSIIDASRILKIPDMTIPIVADGISTADLVVINKKDLVTDVEIGEVRGKIKEIRSEALVIEVSAIEDNGKGLDTFFKMAFSNDYSKSSVAVCSDNQADESVVNNASVHALEMSLKFSEDMAFSQLKEDLICLIEKIAIKLKDAGCSMIGHLKAVLKTDRQGLLLVSTTSFEHKPHVKGMIKADIKEAKLIINAIVYGLDQKVLSELIRVELETISY